MRTVKDWRPNSLHAYFLLGGDPNTPIDYEVDRIRDGGSFATRRVMARQHGEAIFSMGVSFHKPEEGFAHQIPMPTVPPPEDLPSGEDIIAMVPELRRLWTPDNPVQLRPVEPPTKEAGEREAVQHVWFRVGNTGVKTSALPDDPVLHQCLLAYASDFNLLAVAMVPHGGTLFNPKIMAASLNHALWFHQDCRVDDWLLYALDSPVAAGARAFCRGSIFNRDGVLVASAIQEGLIRHRRNMK
jgi:acyl-CoA thioesterase-2